ncbi:hypothetical protein JCM8097_007646 [Rhodosporidiobolus ruineniae]
MGLITHIVSFRYKPSTSDAERHLVASRFLALQDQCELKGERYLSVTGGKQNSPEGLGKGYEHTFVVTFTSSEHRDFYVSDDPAHNAFKELIKDHIADVFVFDFEQGVFSGPGRD